MGSFVLYILEWAFCLLLFLAVYKVCLCGSTFHRFNRLYLLGAIAVSAILPLIHLNVEPEAQTQIQISGTEFAQQLQATKLETINHPLSEVEQPNYWTWVLAGSYILYIIVLFAGWSHAFFKMVKFLHNKQSHHLGRWIKIVSHDEAYGPFSWLNYIVISSHEDATTRKACLLHEYAHVSKFHALDLIILSVCTVLNPVCWLILREIKIVHEYEADAEVIKRHQIRKRDYQLLLIRRTVGAEAYALASSFNVNIKERILMMKKKQSSLWRISCMVATLPVVFISLNVFAEPSNLIAEKINHESEAVLTTVKNEVEKQLPAETKTAEQKSKVVIIDKKLSTEEMMNSLSPEDIKEMKIVKDRATLQTLSKIYGDKVKDGVIIITTTNKADKKSDNKSVVYDVVESMPQFVGGKTAMMEYLAKNVKYPEAALQTGLQGRAVVNFTVNEDGSISDVKCIYNGVSTKEVENTNSKQMQLVIVGQKKNKEFANDKERAEAEAEGKEAIAREAERIVKEMPNWTPATESGKAVRCKYNIPITFGLY